MGLDFIGVVLCEESYNTVINACAGIPSWIHVYLIEFHGTVFFYIDYFTWDYPCAIFSDDLVFLHTDKKTK